MEMKKLMILSPYENRMTRRGNRHPLIANLLSKKGYDLTYVTTNFYHAEKSFFSDDEIEHHKKEAPYEFIVQKNIGYKKLFSMSRIVSHIQFSIKSILPLIKHSPDMVIIPSRPMELIWITSILSIFKKYRTILDVSDVWPDAFPLKGFPKFLFHIYCALYLRTSMWNIKYFAYTSPSYIDWIDRYSKKEKALFIPLGYDRDRWKNWEEPRPDRIFKLVFIGNMASNFDFKPLLDGVGNSKNITLTMIGGGDNVKAVKKYVKNKKYKNITFTGFLDKTEVTERFKDHHIQVIPMIGQSIPNKFFDSLGGCRPLIVFGDYDTSTFVKEKDIGWSIPFEKEAISDLIGNIKEEEYLEKYRNIISIRDRYSKEVLYLDIMQLIEDQLLTQ